MTVQVTNTDYLLAAGQTLTVVDTAAVSVQVAADAFATVTIAGDIHVTASPQTLPPGTVSGVIDGILTNSTNPFAGGQIIVNSGAAMTLDATGSHSQAFGIDERAGQDVSNFGLIHVVADLRGAGINIETSPGNGGPSQLVNAGTIDVTSNQGDALGAEVGGVGGAGGQNTGVIHVVGSTSAVGLQAQTITTFNNSGEIVAHDSVSSVKSIGAWVSMAPGAATFVNSGHIEGDFALKLTGGGQGFGVQNSGQLIGEVDISGGSVALTNTGVITGAVNFSANADTYIGTHGTETGLVSGLGGDDTMLGGAGFDNFQGNQGNDSLSGGGGDDIVVGGKDNDVQDGDDGDDVVWGNLGNDTLDGGAGNDQVRGGQGDDSVSGGAGNDYISGDRGNDTISGGAGADLFHGSQDAGIDRVLDFSQAEGDRVELDPGTTYTLSQVGADTVIDMGPSGGAPNQMILVGVQLSTLKDGWIFEG